MQSETSLEEDSNRQPLQARPKQICLEAESGQER